MRGVTETSRQKSRDGPGTKFVAERDLQGQGAVRPRVNITSNATLMGCWCLCCHQDPLQGFRVSRSGSGVDAG